MADETALAFSDAQHGVFGRSQLVEAGVPTSTIGSHLARGTWIKISPGVYRLRGRPITWSGAVEASQLTGTGLVVSHLSAGRIHRFGSLPTRAAAASAELHVTSTTGRRPSGPWVTHRSSLTRDDVTMANGWRVTTRHRTMLDLASVLTHEQLARVLDTELVSGHCNLEALDRFVAAEGDGLRGVTTLRSLIADRHDVRCESELERRFLSLVRSSGLPELETQVRVAWAGARRNGRIDAAYPSLRIAIELDGRRWHSDSARFESDRHRDQQAAVHGWTIVRFTWTQVTQRPEEVIGVLGALIERAA